MLSGRALSDYSLASTVYGVETKRPVQVCVRISGGLFNLIAHCQ